MDWTRACSVDGCIEVADDGDRVLLRRTDGAWQVACTLDEWDALCYTIRAGLLDHIGEHEPRPSGG